MTTYYHGTDKAPEELDSSSDTVMLRAGSYVTRHFKDAMKFGYRKAVTNGHGTVFMYTVDVDVTKTKSDPKRDRAFVITEPARAVLLSEVDTYAAAHKLRRFHMPAKLD